MNRNKIMSRWPASFSATVFAVALSAPVTLLGADLNDVLKTGQEYKIVSAQDFFGEPVARGTYDGKDIRVPMRPIATERPVGLDDEPPVVTRPRFDVLVVLPMS